MVLPHSSKLFIGLQCVELASGLGERASLTSQFRLKEERSRAGRGRILRDRFSHVYPADVAGVLLSVQLGDGQLTPLVYFLFSALALWYCLEESLALLRRWLGFNLSPSYHATPSLHADHVA